MNILTTTEQSIPKDFYLKYIVFKFVSFPAPHDQYTTLDPLLRVVRLNKLQNKARAVNSDSGYEMDLKMQIVQVVLN